MFEKGKALSSLPRFRFSLLRWYARAKRDLPWRQTRDPYAIWLSEIMLQQTTVKTVIPYYQKFLKKFPTLTSLARASESEYLKMWAGLGYYNRIRNFHKAANVLTNKLEGVVPSSKEKLLPLPGLGDYTASAIASIAFGEPVPVVDGNVMRVLARLHAYAQDIKTTESKKFFFKQATELLDKKNPGDFNQAMMELGATVCTPKNPTCFICPIKKSCKAHKTGTVEKYPLISQKIKFSTEHLISFIAVKNNKVLLRQRKKEEIMSGLWEFPLQKNNQSEIKRKDFMPIKHAIMNRHYVISPQFISGHENKNTWWVDTQWVEIEKITEYPLTTITQKILKKFPLTKLMVTG